MNIDKSKGYIPVWRHLASDDWEWKQDPHTTFLYIWLTAKANFVAKVWKGRTVLAGQYITSINHLSEETGLSKQEVRTALKHLISTHYITHEASKNFSVITINNYDELYTPNTQSNTAATQKQHRANTAPTLTKTGKPFNNENNSNNKEPISVADKYSGL